MIYNYNRLTPFKKYIIQNFPYIDADFDSLNNYGLYCKVVEYLNKVIDEMNGANEQVELLTNAFNTLHDYVEDYFENLDVQEEINNKLDSMTESGELTQLIGAYVEPIQNAFETRIENQIDTINTKVNASVGIQPIPVSSVSDMTNTSKVYVNTTDGYWYYYNGTTWVQGGIYQSTSDNANIEEIKDEIENINGNLNLTDLFEIGNLNISATSWQYSSSTTRIRTKQGTTIHLKVGDVVSITEETVQAYVGYQMKNNVKETLQNAWITNGFTCTIEGDYVMVLRFFGEQTDLSSVNDILQYLKIIRNNKITQINQINNIIKDNNTYIKQYIINDLDLGGYNANGYEMFAYGKINNTRYGHKEVILSNKPIVIEMLDGYEISGQRWTSSTKSVENLYEDTGWQKQLIINPNEYTTFQIKNSSNTQITDIDFDSYFNIYYLENNYKPLFKNSIIKSINHRGYNSVAPENTIPAFKLSKVNGFNIIETDVRLTSDNVPVLLHDATIDRTSNGEGNIASMTYEQALQYDFGSWKSEEYAGTKIPTLEELISLARDINLHCYLELQQNVNFTNEIITSIIEMIKSYGMLEKVTFISFDINLLLMVKAINRDLRFGYLMSNSENYLRSISKLQSVKTEKNEIFYDGDFTALNSSKVNRLKLLNIPYEVWVPYTSEHIINMDPYVTGFTTNTLIAEDVLYNNSIN